MKPAPFPEANLVLKSPENMDNCEDMHAFRDEEFGTIISCWKLSREEIEEVARTGEVWVRVTGTSQAPMTILAERPFIRQRGQLEPVPDIEEEPSQARRDREDPSLF